MPRLTAGTSFTGHTILTASSLNTRFANTENTLISYGAFLDDIQTFTAAQTFSGAVAMSGGLSLSTTGLTIAPQTAITFSNAAARIIPGATSVTFRDTANANDNLSIADAGTVTIRAGLTVSSGTITGTLATAAQPNVTSLGSLTALTFADGTVKEKLGTGTLQLRNSGDTRNVATFADTAIALGDTTNVTTTIQGNSLTIQSGGGASLTVGTGNLTLGTSGSLATNATTGFFYVPTMAGAPTGNPGNCAHTVDTSGNKAYWHMGAGVWKGVAIA